ncbi:unnamed protein product, partial [Iphiclides podalirius]
MNCCSLVSLKLENGWNNLANSAKSAKSDILTLKMHATITVLTVLCAAICCAQPLRKHVTEEVLPNRPPYAFSQPIGIARPLNTLSEEASLQPRRQYLIRLPLRKPHDNQNKRSDVYEFNLFAHDY